MKCRHLNSFVRFHFTVELTKIHFKFYRMFVCFPIFNTLLTATSTEWLFQFAGL